MSDSPYGSIQVRGARENNLAGVSLDIPKRRLTVFTGVSGSGKSSLVFDTIAAESRRLINETYTAFIQGFMPALARPDVDSLHNLSAAILVDQERMGANTRSTVGTATDAWSMLRILFSRLATPHVGSALMFSFNDPQGACPECEGTGQVSAIDVDAMVDRDLSLNEGAITLPNYQVDGWYWRIFAESGYFDPDTKLRDYTDAEWEQFLRGPKAKIATELMNMTYEGLEDKVRRTLLSKDVDSLQPHVRKVVERIATFATCPDCAGGRLNAAARAARLEGRSITECGAMQVSDLLPVIEGVQEPSAAPLLASLTQILQGMVDIGLGYLSLDRSSGSLSGGEAQRVKMVRHLGSSLTDLTYVLDEPTAGLHPHDVQRMIGLLQQLRDKGNTVLVVEHEPAVILQADHVVDMGPGAGSAGGQIVFEGDVAGLADSDTATGRHLGTRQPLRTSTRTPTGHLSIRDATLHNLQDVSVEIPTGVMTAVTGVAGSGKSSLIMGYLTTRPEVTVLDQTPIRGSRRSNPATYTGMLDGIRKAFAKANGVKASLFSANSDGACEVCKGLGVIYPDLGFMAGVPSQCEACEGRRFSDDVLAHTLRGQDISQVLAMSITEAREFLTEKAVAPMLAALHDVGIGYIVLGQPLTTLSGGERQRLKLAIELAGASEVFVLDEPTSGLHMADVDHLVTLLDRMVEEGRTIVVVEHNTDVIARADWVIDLGPGAGHDGGTIVFEGTPADLAAHPTSLTGRHLAEGHVGA